MVRLLFLLFLINPKKILGEPIIKDKLVPLIPSETYSHNEYVDEDNKNQFKIFWKILESDEIQFEVHCKTSGWVALGISANGGMRDADIAIGWYDSKQSKAVLKDCHATDKITPILDNEQNWHLIDGAEIDGYTILKYKRKLKTCDVEHDKEIKTGTTFMIFAWNDEDPKCTDWKYHGTNRYTKSVLLLNYKDQDLTEQEFLPADVTTVDFKMRNIKLPAQETYYYCDFFEIPKYDKNKHIIQYEILVNKKNKKNVHHLVAYECEIGYIPPENVGQECGAVSLPNELALNCQKNLFIGWGIGGQYNYSFPKQAGYPLDADGKSRYIMIEMHYDNPELIEGLYDDSGVRLYLTEQLREHELGLFAMGADLSTLSLQIPPHSSNFYFSSICYPQCTNAFIPDKGINLVSALLHTHLAGKSVRVSLIRSGKLVQRLFENPNYDFNYQYLIDIKPFTIYKNDSIVTECLYQSHNRDNFTLQGFGTHEEMCSIFVYYYPKLPIFNTCISPISNKALIEFYRSLMRDDLMPNIPINDNENIYANKLIINALRNDMPKSQELTKRFEQFFESSYNKAVICGYPDNENLMFLDNVPHYSASENLITEKSCDATKYENKECFIKDSGFKLKPSLIIILVLLFLFREYF